MDHEASSLESLPSYGDRVREFEPKERTTATAHLATAAMFMVVLATVAAYLGVAAILPIVHAPDPFERPLPRSLIQSIESEGAVAVVSCTPVWGSSVVEGHQLELWSAGHSMKFVADDYSRTPTRITNVYVDWGPVPDAGVLIKLDHDTLVLHGIVLHSIDDAFEHRAAIIRLANGLRGTHATGHGTYEPRTGDLRFHTTGIGASER
ncbi:MAG: hypothetical protein AB8G96_03960 [Phycisphaerales bacterium]